MESQWSRRLSWFHHQLWLLHFRGYCIWVRAILRTTWRQNQHLRWFYHSRLDKYKALFCWRKELYPINLAKPLRILKTIRYTIKLNTILFLEVVLAKQNWLPVLGVSILSLFLLFSIGFWNCFDDVLFSSFTFYFIHKICST